VAAPPDAFVIADSRLLRAGSGGEAIVRHWQPRALGFL
jgi:hypothetical protein